MEQKKYRSITRFGKKGTEEVLKGNIVIQEKIDGANASFKVEDGKIKFFSRNNELDASNTLRGFSTWGMKHLGNVGFEKVRENFIFFGEWLVPHKVQYNEEAFGQFYLFDIYDAEKELYLPFEEVKNAAEEFKLNLVPVMYQGPFQSLEHIKSFVGMSRLGPVGEGVVVKNEEQLYAKFVSDAFAEMANVKKHSIKAPATDSLQVFIESTVTKGRVEKLLHKAVDEGHLAEDFAIEHMRDILKFMGHRIMEDILKEDSDILFKLMQPKIGKYMPLIVKEVLKEMGRM